MDFDQPLDFEIDLHKIRKSIASRSSFPFRLSTIWQITGTTSMDAAISLVQRHLTPDLDYCRFSLDTLEVENSNPGRVVYLLSVHGLSDLCLLADNPQGRYTRQVIVKLQKEWEDSMSEKVDDYESSPKNDFNEVAEFCLNTAFCLRKVSAALQSFWIEANSHKEDYQKEAGNQAAKLAMAWDGFGQRIEIIQDLVYEQDKFASNVVNIMDHYKSFEDPDDKA